MLLLAIAVSAAPVPVVQSVGPVNSAECPRTTAHVAVNQGKTPPLRKLNELPPANAYSAVFRQVNGCEKPIVVRYDIGRR